jgi:AraC-like DNA-binding protein
MLNKNYKTANLYTDDFLLAINPYIRLAYYNTLSPHKTIGERIIYDYEIVLFKSGTATITVEDHVYDAGPGDLFLFKPGQRHSFTVHNEPLVQPHIHFDLHYFADTSKVVPISFKNLSEMTEAEQALVRPDITDGFFRSFPSHIHLRNPMYIEQLIFDVINTYRSPSIFPEIRLKWCFLRLLDQLLCEINWQNTDHLLQKGERASLIKQYLDYHTDRQVTLEELAKVYHIDKSYVSRIFRETYDITPMRYHLLQRTEKAKLLIRYTNLSLTQIAEQTGFSSLQDFSRAFRRATGMVPSEYRKQ